MSNVITNRQARFDFEILETEVAGIILTGSEMKPLRSGEAKISEAFIWIDIDKNEVWIKNMYIKNKNNAAFTHEELRDRRLLLTKKQLAKWANETINRGITIVPLKGFFDDKNRFKLEIALSKGKKNWDKKDKIKERDIAKDTQRELKNL